MTKNITLTMLVFLICGMTSFGQKLVERNYFQANPRLGGEVLINESSKETIGDKTFTRFVINADRAGAYTMNLWMMATELPDGTYSSYDVLVNGMKIDGRVAPTRGDWQNIGLTTGKVNLRQGKNTISFVAQVPEIPEIEFLRLSQNAGLATISSAKYDAYKAEIKANIIEEPKAPSRIVGGPGTIVNPDWPLYPFANDTLSYVIWQPWNKPQFTNPEGNYEYSMSIPVKYTYYRTVSLTVGQSFFVATDGVNNFGHILELFHSTKPEQYSWVNKANSRCLAAIDITVPETGTYYVRVRSDKNGKSGTTNLNINGQNYYNGIPLYSAGIRVTQDSETIYNTFTCYATTDPRIWIEEGAGSATPGKISAFNDDYNGTGDFNWGSNSRIKGRFPRTMHAVQVTAYSSSSPSGVCDLYAKCRNSAIWASFPGFKSDDAIQSAPISTKYNAFAWSGGITQRPEWPYLNFSQYYVLNNGLASFDKFYLTPRYNGCGIFTRTGANESNSVVDLYAKVVNGTTIFESASITKGADNHPHGFAWETKVGDNMRTFHPRYALKTTGQIVYYYKRIGTGQLYTLAEAIADNKATIEQVSFTSFERTIISAQKETMSTSEINNFNTKYNAWKTICNNNFSSSSTTFQSFSEFTTLVNYCNSVPGTEFLVYEKLDNDEDLAVVLLDKITLSGSVSNRNKLEEIKKVNAQQIIASNGATIVRFPYTNAMKLVKSILSAPMYSPLKSDARTTGVDGISYSNSDKFTVINRNGEVTMTFILSNDSKVSLSIMDLNARPVSTLLKSQSMVSGEYDFNASLNPGIYLVELFVNGNYNVKKIIVN